MTFREISGSPVENVSESGGQTVERILLVPYEERFARIQALQGALYPHFSDCRIHSFRIEPFDESAPIGPFVLDPLIATNDYTGKLAKVTFGYGPDFTNKIWPITKPAFRVSTELRYTIQSGGEFLTIGPSAAQWDDDPNIPLTESVDTAILVTRESYKIQWDFVDDVPRDELDGLKGKVNETEFLSAAPETLLFLGYQIDETHQASPVNSHTNRVTCDFLKKEFIVDDVNTVGWNHDYRQEPAGWHRVLLSDGQPRYKLDEFGDMFL